MTDFILLVLVCGNVGETPAGEGTSETEPPNDKSVSVTDWLALVSNVRG